MQVQAKHNDIREQSAFTLIELLVVAAIILLLISLLVPGLRYAMEQARSTRCQSNLRQITTAIQMYVEDHNGHMPLLHPTDMAGWRWQNRQLQLFEPYISPRSNVYRCPSATAENSGEALHGYQGGRYCTDDFGEPTVCTDYKIADDATGINAGPVISEPGRGTAGHPVWTFKDHTWIVAALDLEFLGLDGSARHGDGINVAFLAGHVMWFSIEDVYQPDPYGNVPWWKWGLDPALR